MKEVDNLDSIKEEWVCETGPPDNQSLNDNQQRDCEYFVDSLFEEAEKVGAKCLSPTEQKKQVDINIKLWKNGFTVNDDFRSYSDGASQQFLNSIKKGELPSELQGIFDKEEVDVKVEDKKNEVCMSTKPVFQPFSGQGHRLGSATPKVISKAKSIEVENKSTLSAVPLNNLEPITRIQIWLANGERTVQRFNVSHRCMTIGELLLGEDNRKLGGPGYPQAGQTTAKDCWGPKGPAACTPRAAPTRLDPPQAQQSPELRSQRSSPEMSLPQEPTQAARVAEPHTQEPGSENRANRLSVCTKVCYGIGGVPNQVASSASAFYLQIFLLDVAQARLYCIAAAVVALTYPVCGGLLCLGVKERPDTSAPASGTGLSFFTGLAVTSRHPPYLNLVVSFLFISAAVQVEQSYLVLFCTHASRLQDHVQNLVLTILVMVPFSILLAAVPSAPVAYVVAFVSGVSIAVSLLLPWSMLPDVVDDFQLQHQYGPGVETIFYSSYVFFTKLSGAGALGISTLSLESVLGLGYTTNTKD
ncbi:major facilitator superfamily domain-containing protein 2B [Cricetulus griseus]|uniref:Major facilitator superfamily domain-containing protein 2B n=1 Tax=Cricetulus griseus TaxID=10029 RepID=A0A061HWW6_CRIGR|nr:major facilitator superfamily domain-containing protein 2B [Cricetulus griseus]